MGRYFKGALKNFIKRENFTFEEWKNFQEQSLRNLLIYSYNYVPYYAKKFREIGLKIKDLENFSLKNLKQLPLLEKKDVQDNLKEFISKKFKKYFLHSYETGGTTGTPLKIFYSSKSHSRVYSANVARIFNWANIKPTERHITFGGRSLFQEKHKPFFWRYNFFEKQLYMSAFHLSPESVFYYVQKINSFFPVYINGYTSAIYYVAKHIVENGWESIKVKAIFTSSDKLTKNMRQVIQKAWECPVYDGYSSVEGCCLISECQYQNLHISPDVGIVEILSEDEREVEPGEVGEIVATGLLNLDFPLIRYKMGDFAIKSENKKCNCGRQTPLVEEILGREEDYLILKDGRASASFSKAFEGVEGIYEGQVIQEDYDKIKVLLVKNNKFNEKEKEKFLKNINKIFGPLIVELEFVEKIERTKRGKLKLVINKIEKSSYGKF